MPAPLVSTAYSDRRNALFTSPESAQTVYGRVFTHLIQEKINGNGDASWDAGIPVVASRFDRGANEFDRIYENVRLIGPDMDKVIAL